MNYRKYASEVISNYFKNNRQSLDEFYPTERKTIEFAALNHIQFLEGMDGLAWRCEKLSKYNSNLNRKLFHGLIHFSRQQVLMDIIRNRKQIRLYLLFMIESQKAYKRLQKDYLDNHFMHLDEGWDDALSEDEVEQFEREESNDSNSPLRTATVVGVIVAEPRSSYSPFHKVPVLPAVRCCSSHSAPLPHVK